MSVKIKSDPNSPVAENVEDVGTADDSGFASISVRMATGNKESDSEENKGAVDTIAGDVKINNGPLETEEELAPKLKRKREIDEESKRLALEEYNKEIREKQYKRLMHLLDRSQFYSQYLVKKIEESVQTEEKKTDKRKARIGNENLPPKKKVKKFTKYEKDYHIREYVNIENGSVPRHTILIAPLALYVCIFTISFFCYGLLA